MEETTLAPSLPFVRTGMGARHGDINGNANVHGNSHVYDDAHVYRDPDIHGNGNFHDNPHGHADTKSDKVRHSKEKPGVGQRMEMRGFFLAFLMAASVEANHLIASTGVMYGTAGTPATLAAAGAYTTGSVLSLKATATSLGAHTVTLFFRYTRGGAGGSVGFFIDIQAMDGKWYTDTAIKDEAFTAGANLTTDLQRIRNLYTSTAAGEETFLITLSNVYGNAIRIRSAEVGATGTPGTFACFGVALTSEHDDSGR